MNTTTETTIGIIGVVLGFFLSEVAARLRDAQAQRRQANAIRTMITHEIAHNLQRLQVAWSLMNPSGQLIDEESQQRAYAENLVEQIGLSFPRDVLTSQLPNLSLALAANEIDAVFTVYDRFAQLTTIQQTLAEYQAEQRGYVSGSPLPTPNAPPLVRPATPFRDKAPDLWNTYQLTTIQLLKQGNPLR